MSTKILIADDEENIRNIIKKYALHEGYEVLEAKDGEEAIKLALENKVDLLIMDVMMPRLDGFKAYAKIKEKDDIPCIFLTALNEEYDRIYGFDVGADDYVVKPFSANELMKRVRAVLKRAKPSKSDSLLTQKGLKVDLAAHRVYVDDREVSLSLKEYDLLLYLMQNKGVALTRESILEKVWGYDYFKDDRTLDTHIKLLRKSLGPYASFIVTIRGVGYRFEKES